MPAVGGLRLRKGHFKEPIQGLVVYVLLLRVGEFVTADAARFVGTMETMLLIIVAAYVAVVVYEATREPDDSPTITAADVPDRTLAAGLTVGGVVAVALVWILGAETIAAWVTAFVGGPGSGQAARASELEVALWLVVAVVGSEALSRGVDGLTFGILWRDVGRD